jgi:VanZ family protein
VVDRRALDARDRGDELLDLDPHRLDDRLRALAVPRGLAQSLDLLIGGVEVGRSVLQEHGDLELLEPVHEPARIVGGDDEVGLVARDRLDIGLEARKIRHRRVGRVVRLVVDGDHLLTGADREQRLGGRGGERDDGVGLLGERQSAVVGLDRDREVGGRLLGRGRGCRRSGRLGIVAAATCEDEGEQDRQGGCEGSREHVSSFREGNGSEAGGRSSDSGLPPPPPSRPGGQWRLAKERLPSQRRDRAGLAPASLERSPGFVAEHTPSLGWTAVAAARVNLWLPVVLWAALIFTFSAIPSLGTGLGTWDLVLRKLAHVAEYAVLGGLLMRAVRREPLAFVLGSLYAVTDEVHQAFVSGREGSPLDWLVDTVGVALGVLLYARWAASRA